MVNSALSRTAWNFSAAALAFLLFAMNVAVPLHQATHGAALAASGHMECGGREFLLQTHEGHGDHRHGDEACVICQGANRIVGILPATPSNAPELTGPTGALGSPGTLHGVPAGHEFQRGPPREDFPVTGA